MNFSPTPNSYNKTQCWNDISTFIRKLKLYSHIHKFITRRDKRGAIVIIDVDDYVKGENLNRIEIKYQGKDKYQGQD